MKNNIAIQLTNITKTYIIHHEKPTLVEKFIKGKDEHFTALNNINLTIKKGEKVGIIGPNGSGKTTLLKIIAGITTPTSGTIKTNGKIVSLIDLEAGFHPDLSGYQNIFINGLLLGITRQKILQKLHNIIQYAGIKQFIDAPMYTYSEGMKLRLGFSIAVYAKPDILILDECISVGDIVFQEKTHRKIQELIHRGTTFLVASHWIEFFKKNTSRIIIFHKGNVRKDEKTKILIKGNFL